MYWTLGACHWLSTKWLSCAVMPSSLPLIPTAPWLGSTSHLMPCLAPQSTAYEKLRVPRGHSMGPLRMFMTSWWRPTWQGLPCLLIWNRRGGPRPAAGLVAVPAAQTALQMASRFCTKLSPGVTEGHRAILQQCESVGRVTEGGNFWIAGVSQTAHTGKHHCGSV